MEKQSRIRFLNQPKPLAERASGYEKDEYERKMALIPCVEHFLSSNDSFKGKDVSVTFPHTGVSSLVCILEADGEKTVLKIPVSINLPEGESDCLKSWELVGVSVPHVIQEGMIEGRPYILMSHIDAVRLMDVPAEKADKEIYMKLGRTLRQMHQSKACGYGRIKNHKAEHVQFRDWLNSEYEQRMINHVRARNIIDDEKHGSLSKALEILTMYVESNPQSAYCHHDFSTGSTFATDPIAVFDPNPLINHPIIDIARSVVLIAGSGPNENVRQFIDQMMEGYFGEEAHDKQAFQAAILLNAHSKIFNWRNSGRTQNIENMLAYLSETKHLLSWQGPMKGRVIE